MATYRGSYSGPGLHPKRPRLTLSSRESETVEHYAKLRAESLNVQVDEFIRTDIPPRLRIDPLIHNVGHIIGSDGKLLTLIRSDYAQGVQLVHGSRLPSIGMLRVLDKRVIELLAVLTPDAAAGLALLLSGIHPSADVADFAGLDEGSLMASGHYAGEPRGAVIAAYAPQRLAADSAFIGAIAMLGGENGFLIRGPDGGVSMSLPPDWIAHMSLPATEAFAEVLAEFAMAHGVELRWRQ